MTDIGVSLARPLAGSGRQRQLAVEFSGSVGVRQVSTHLRQLRRAAFGQSICPRLAQQTIPQQRQYDARMEQLRWRIGQHHHFDECIRYRCIAVGCLVYMADVPVDDAGAQYSLSLNARITKIFPCSNQPRTVNSNGCAPKVFSRKAGREISRTHPRETPIQYLSFDGAYRHTLSVNGIEAAHRVSDDKISIGKPAHLFVVTSKI